MQFVSKYLKVAVDVKQIKSDWLQYRTAASDKYRARINQLHEQLHVKRAMIAADLGLE